MKNFSGASLSNNSNKYFCWIKKNRDRENELSFELCKNSAINGNCQAQYEVGNHCIISDDEKKALFIGKSFFLVYKIFLSIMT